VTQPDAELADQHRLPIAIFTDHSSARVWVLTGTITWWSLMMIFQSLSNHFWQMICARLGMFLGQAASEAVSYGSVAADIRSRYRSFPTLSRSDSSP